LLLWTRVRDCPFAQISTVVRNVLRKIEADKTK
jgi:hypothetical protein